MRKVTHAGPEDESGIDLTPLIDCVFIMLIFFIVTASFVKETGIEVNKPTAVTALIRPKASILIALDASDNVWIDRRKLDIRAVKAAVERLHSENPQGTVVIEADNESKNALLVAVMDACRQAGITQIAIAAND